MLGALLGGLGEPVLSTFVELVGEDEAKLERLEELIQAEARGEEVMELRGWQIAFAGIENFFLFNTALSVVAFIVASLFRRSVLDRILASGRQRACLRRGAGRPASRVGLAGLRLAVSCAVARR